MKISVPPGSWSLQTRILMSYLILLLIAMVSSAVRHYSVTSDVIKETAARSVHQLLIKNNDLLDGMMERVDGITATLMGDEILFDTFVSLADPHSANLLAVNRRLSAGVLSRGFALTPEVRASQLVTSYWVFGSNPSSINPHTFMQTEIYAAAAEAEGRLVWIPTFDFARMYLRDELADLRVTDRNLFACARVMNLFAFKNERFESLPEDVEIPVLVADFTTETVERYFEGILPYEGAGYYVIAPDNTVVAASEKALEGSKFDAVWYNELAGAGSDTVWIDIDGESTLVGFDCSNVAGWTAVATVPAKSLLSPAASRIRRSLILFSVLFSAVAAAFSFFLARRISSPVRALVETMRKTGAGNFDARISLDDHSEFRYLLRAFNRMNEKISGLIEENYCSKIRRNETEIVALNLQFNPHFVYNTLNVINWMAIEAGHSEISKVASSMGDMLAYTLRDRNDVAELRQDLAWLDGYAAIMRYRYEGRIELHVDVDEELLSMTVPKLFLQPLVENAILHGLKDRDEGGRIEISGRGDDCRAVFTVTDNGVGAVPQDFGAGSHRVGTGIANVARRIELLYGADYGVHIDSIPGRGTTITVTLPIITP